MNYGAALWINDILVLTEDRELSWDSEKKWESKGVLTFTKNFEAGTHKIAVMGASSTDEY
jgi:hypothetical protein